MFAGDSLFAPKAVEMAMSFTLWDSGALLTSKKNKSAEELDVDSQSPGFVSLKHSFALLLKFYSRFTSTILFPLLILLLPSFFFLPNQRRVPQVRKAIFTVSRC